MSAGEVFSKPRNLRPEVGKEQASLQLRQAAFEGDEVESATQLLIRKFQVGVITDEVPSRRSQKST